MSYRSTFVNDSEGMYWLREVHLPKLPVKFKSAMIWGNEDFPVQVDVFTDINPKIYDNYTTYKADKNGRLTKQRPKPKVAR